MRAVVSRVSWARVVADGEPTGEIGPGLLVLVGVTHGDGDAEARWLAAKVAGLRVFDDDGGKMNRSLAEVGGGVLVVSQFTLYGDARKGRRPSYVAAAPPELAAPLVEAVAQGLAAEGVPVGHAGGVGRRRPGHDPARQRQVVLGTGRPRWCARRRLASTAPTVAALTAATTAGMPLAWNQVSSGHPAWRSR